MQANLILQVPGLADYQTGTSTGDASAGNGASLPPTDAEKLATRRMTASNKAGAAIVTIIMLVAMTAFVVVLVAEDLSFDKRSRRFSLGPITPAQIRTQWHGR